MNARVPVLAEIRRLQGQDQRWRHEHPDWSLRIDLLGLVTSCGFQGFTDHAVENDLALLARVAAVRDDPAQRRTGSTVEAGSLDCADALRSTLSDPLRPGDLDAIDAARTVLIETPQRALLGRDDDEARGELVCWNEVNGSIEGVAGPYRCASRISALAYFDTPDRYRVIEPMTALRERYERHAEERVELDLEIRTEAEAFRQRFAADQCLP